MQYTSTHHRFAAAAVAMTALSLLVACGTDNQAGGAQFAMPPMPVSVTSVEPRSVAVEGDYAGRVHAVREVEVRARVGGILERRLYVEGRAVRDGEPLFRIDPEPYEIEVRRALAERADAAASLEQAQREQRRIEELYRRESVSQRDVDEAETTRRLAEARLERADAEVADARRNLRYTEVRAPVDGVTGLETLSEGSLVEPGTLLTTITQLDPVHVRFSLPEADARRHRAARASVGSEPAVARLRMTDGAHYEQAGEVDFTDSRVDAGTGTVAARAVFPNEDGVLIPGQFVRVSLLLDRLEGVFVVDPTAIGQGADGPRVFVVENGDVARARSVVPGPLIDEGQVVLRGLRAGDRVVVNGQVALADGAAVSVRAASGG